jgi:hypothetical protein
MGPIFYDGKENPEKLKKFSGRKSGGLASRSLGGSTIMDRYF